MWAQLVVIKHLSEYGILKLANENYHIFVFFFNDVGELFQSKSSSFPRYSISKI
jgi:hypothetical protein